MNINVLTFIPTEIRQQLQNALVDFISAQAKKYLNDQFSEKIQKLRSDASFQKQFENGLSRAIRRFTIEYDEIDEDLTQAIVDEQDLFKNREIRNALLTILRNPGSYIKEEKDYLISSFDSVLPTRKNRKRVNDAVSHLIKCLVEELWHLPEFQPIYSLEFERQISLDVHRQVELQKSQLEALTSLNDNVRQALVELTNAILEKKQHPGDGQDKLRTKVMHNLPQPDYEQFIGREKELEQSHKILKPYPFSQHALVTIDGIGGIGKSTLALQIAYNYLNNFDTLPEDERFDAIIWTSAKTTTLTADGIQTRHQAIRTLKDIHGTIAIVLQRDDINRVPEELQAEVVRNALQKQRTLLIVDNLETIDDEKVISFVRELPAPTKAIVTTRHRIDVAYSIRLMGMSREEALNLIKQDCVRKGVDIAASDAELLYQRTGGLPLAMIWSISHLFLCHSINSILRKLGDVRSDIAKFCFDEVVRYLADRSSYEVLLVTSFSPTSFSREAVGQITDLADMDRDDNIGELEKLSLITKSEDRFLMLPLTRSYCLHELELDTNLHQLLRNQWVAYFKEFSRGLRKRNQRLEANDPDIANISEAIEWCWGTQAYRDFLQLVDYSHSLFWNAENWATLITYYQRGLQAAAELNDELMEALLTRWYADILDFQDNSVEAEEKANQAISQFRKLKEYKHLVIAIYRISSVYRKQKRFEEAYKIVYEGLEISQKLSNPSLLLSIYGRLANLALDEGLPDKAQGFLDKAWEVQSILPVHERETWRVANIYNLMGRVCAKKEDYDQSIMYLQKAIDLGIIAKVPQAVAEAQWELATTLFHAGALDDAQRYLEKASSEFARLGMRRYADLNAQFQARIMVARKEM